MVLVCTPLERLGAFRVVWLGGDCTPFGLTFLQSGPDRWWGDDVISLSLFNGFWSHCTTCGILVPRAGIKLMPPAVEPQSLNHWTALSSLIRFSSLPWCQERVWVWILTPSLQTHLLSQLPAFLPFVNCM